MKVCAAALSPLAAAPFAADAPVSAKNPSASMDSATVTLLT